MIGWGRAPALVALLLIAAGPSAGADPVPTANRTAVAPDCAPEGPLTPICGFVGPEDIESLPGGGALVVSARRSGDRPAPLALLVLHNQERRILYDGTSPAERRAGWGDPACSGPLADGISSHGLSLRRRADGALMLAVVQHGGGRESVEMLELLGSGSDWRAVWRGCVVAPSGVRFNDVGLLADGGFVAAHVGTPGRPGAVYRWTPAHGFAEVPGTRGDYPNGVLVAPGDRRIVVTYSFGDEVRLVDLASGRRLASVRTQSPDNAAWSPSGRLLVASVDQTSGPTFPQCYAAARGACPKRYRILSYDADLRHEKVLHEGGGALMGAASVGVAVGRDLFVGSAVGDRLLRITLPTVP